VPIEILSPVELFSAERAFVAIRISEAQNQERTVSKCDANAISVEEASWLCKDAIAIKNQA
jgi:hypothetical protein